MHVLQHVPSAVLMKCVSFCLIKYTICMKIDVLEAVYCYCALQFGVLYGLKNMEIRNVSQQVFTHMVTVTEMW